MELIPFKAEHDFLGTTIGVFNPKVAGNYEMGPYHLGLEYHPNRWLKLSVSNIKTKQRISWLELLIRTGTSQSTIEKIYKELWDENPE